MDAKDKEILHILQQYGRISLSELANRVNLSDTPCVRRVKKLEQEGIIASYNAVLNDKKIGLNVLVYAFVKLKANTEDFGQQFEQAMFELDNIIECCTISGSHDYLLKIVAASLEDYELFVKKSLGNVNTIAAIESTVVLKQTFSKNTLPLK
ncbi:Lrp/AsnC family transcriptional regulator [Thalassotalea agarivorans]|uniref:Transcriptional regulator, AsnC family n=1 Tax=Thalassotalea agarivorans TaxID=349064 RepID=A0A1I0HZ63_THASX|nr:Lrp/AsnC family transcriptional regulator [Thalassotalea agarivorans]SET89590.1 transcriptional regulator, AsnC family [Thalassotalea agarivorans]